MRNSFLITAVSLIALLVALSSLARKESSEPILSGKQSIGVILPLSGALAEFGVAVKNGIALAQQDYPDRFGGLEFIFEDSSYDPKTSISSLHKLSRLDDISLIFNWGTATGQALAPVAESLKIPLITNSQTAGVSQGRDYVIRFINPSDDFSKALLKSMRAKGYKRLAIVKTELGYINDLLEGMQENLAANESIEVVDSYQTSDQDFSSTITKLKSKNYDAVGVFLISGQISQFYRQLARQGLAIPTFGSDFFESESEIAEAGPSIEGAIYANIMVADDFRAKYSTVFGNSTHLTYASNAYDFALLSAELFEAVPTDATAADVIESYQTIESKVATSGGFEFVRSENDDKYFSFPVVVKTIAGGKILVLQE